MSLEPFLRVTGVAAPFPAANVDTDVIMPKQFLKGVDRAGLGDGAFYDLKHRPDGSLNPGFVLNQSPWSAASFLVVGPNFGCGSSREHAVWGLRQLGVRALFGASFAGIFYDNCARNGLLALSLSPSVVDRLLALSSDPASSVMTVDLPDQTIQLASGVLLEFAIDASLKAALVAGLDLIGQTLEHGDEVARFEARRHREQPWLLHTRQGSSEPAARALATR
jgi:3-isopropylmalate/(R)-2-methylmalate dehydratase small subunit